MNKYVVIKILLLFYMIALGCYMYGILPDQIPIHWGVEGTPDKMGDKLVNIVMFPIIVASMIVLFPILSKVDPKKENYEKFGPAWEMIQLTIIGFFTYIYTIILYLSLHTELKISQFMMAGLGIMFLFLGNYMGKIRQNYFVGIKLPWTLSNEDVWNKTHRLSGKMFVIGGILLLINSYLNFYVFPVFIVTLVFIVILPIMYAYNLYKKHKKNA